jgi:prepilin-type N-terminal cleavage/methylation domain-containing protein
MRARKCGAGFTLIECLVATVILGIGVVGVASMFAYASASQKKAEYMAQARDIAERTLEQVRASGYSAFAAPSGVGEVDTSGLPHSAGVVAWQPWPDPSSEQGLKLVAININWHWGGGAGGQYRVATLVAQ